MVDNVRRVVKVFLASPSDLQDERSLAKNTVDEFNETFGRAFGYHVDLVGWEDTIAGYGRPQALINRDVEQCEYFIGLMWQRWGTPPDAKDGRFSSGFEEEFELVLDRRTREGKPEISLFFKEIAPQLLADPGESLTRVLAFRKKMETEKLVLFETFKDERDYLRKLRRGLFSYVQRLGIVQPTTLQPEQQSQEVDSETKSEAPSADPLIALAGLQFARRFLDRAQNEALTLSRVDIARFRLLGAVARRLGNDEAVLGIHDANLIYLNILNTDDLGLDERRGLADAGLSYFYPGQNAPLWKWLASVNLNYFLSISTFFGSTDQRRGALYSMNLIGEPLWLDDEGVDRAYYLDRWFDADVHSSIKVAALTYLGNAGIAGDVSWIKAEIDRNDFQTRTTAERAIIMIKLREGVPAAIQEISELQPSDLTEELAAAIFNEDSSIDQATLQSMMSQRGPNIKRAVLKLAKHNRLLTVEWASRLLSEAEVDIRFEALRFLQDHGQIFSEADAKKILVKPSSGLSYDQVGERAFEQFRISTFKALPIEQLNERIETSWAYSIAPYIARVEKYFERYGSQLRADIADRFQTYFDQRVAYMESVFGEQQSGVKNLSDYLRKEHTRAALDVLCQESTSEDDLPLVRNILRSEFVEYSDADAIFLARFGNWSDIELLIAMTSRPAHRGALLALLSYNDEMYVNVAKAMLRLARNRLQELLEMAMPALLKREIVNAASQVSFSKLSNDHLCQLLRSDDAQLRKTICLKCLKAFSKSRLRKITAKYVGDLQQTHYYNVIHWLDFGVSMPTKYIAAAARHWSDIGSI